MTVRGLNVVWLQAGGCSGCAVSLLDSPRPAAARLLLGALTPNARLNLRFLTTLMAAQGAEAVAALDGADEGFVLVQEGALPERERFCTVGERAGEEVPALGEFCRLAERAALVVAVGTCAAFGGLPAGAPNPGAFRSAGDVMAARGIATPLTNVPGCPPHPDWFTTTLLEYVDLGAALRLDALRRPLSIYGRLIHENCPRRSYFDEGKFAERPGEVGCLNRVGCKGPITYADCPLREWNGGVNWCVKAGAPCQGCTQPEFIEQAAPFYRPLDEDRMPRVGATRPG